jgi:hypothetical protein
MSSRVGNKLPIHPYFQLVSASIELPDIVASTSRQAQTDAMMPG